MAVEHVVTAQSDIIRWKLLSREHGWKSPDGHSGFIDLVLEDQWGSSVLAIECKRVRDTEWLFLTDARARQVSGRARLWITNTTGHGREYFGYFDALAEPKSLESAFCVVPGQDAKSRPMLERLASELTTATEALAHEEHPLITERSYGLRMYGSVIVTTARIVCSAVDTSQVELATGDVPAAAHEEVPWVRFRKALSSEPAVEPTNPGWDFSSLATAKEKAVFVVHVLALTDFLREWAVVDASLNPLKYR
jgi:hypothetical protein